MRLKRKDGVRVEDARFQACLVAKGFTWREAIDFCHTRHRGGPQKIISNMEKEQISGIVFF
jgi:hypothetical protein